MSRSALALSVAFLLPVTAGAAVGAGTFGTLDEFARAVGMKQGGWRTRVKVTTAEIRTSPAPDPAHLAKVRAQIERQIGVVEEKHECAVTAAKGAPSLPGIILEPGCSYNRLHAAGGRWALSYGCAVSANDEMATMKSEGTYSRKAITGRHEGDIRYQGVVLHLKAETESRYVGKCRAPKPFDVTAERN